MIRPSGNGLVTDFKGLLKDLSALLTISPRWEFKGDRKGIGRRPPVVLVMSQRVEGCGAGIDEVQIPPRQVNESMHYQAGQSEA
jgi:hypothetical protein